MNLRFSFYNYKLTPMNLFLSLLCILSLLLAGHGQKQCFTKKPTTSEKGPLKMSLTDPIKDFQSGSYSIVNKNPQNGQRFTCFNITFLYINGKNQYEVVASIQNIENYQDKEGLDFSVRFTPNPTVIEGLFIISKTATWTLATIHYVISARQDFRVGTFVPETAQFLPCGKEASELIINHKLVRAWNSTKKLVFGLPFLSGIRTMDTEININFNKSTFDADTSLLQIPMSFDDVHFPVEYLLISYLIVTMNSQFQITNIYDLDYIPGDLNVFVGMTGVKTVTTPKVNASSTPVTPVNVSANSRALKTGTNNASTASKNKFRQFFEVQGLVIQSSSNLDVLFSTGNYSPNSTIECISAKECQRYDGFMKYYQNEDGFVFRSECIVCEKFAFFDMGSNQCVCRDNYVRVGSACVAKDAACDKATQVWSDKLKKCECATGFTEKNGICVANTICPQGFTLFKGNCYRITNTGSTGSTGSSTTGSNSATSASTTTITTSTSTSTPTNPTQQASTISQQCQSPQVWNDTSKSCQCPANANFDDVNRRCVVCRQNQVWNQKTKTCECISGSFRINGICDFCSIQGFFNGTGCQCLPGFLGNGKICRADPKFTNETLGLTTSTTKTNDVISGGSTTESQNPQQDTKPVVLGQIRIN